MLEESLAVGVGGVGFRARTQPFLPVMIGKDSKEKHAWELRTDKIETHPQVSG